MVPMGRRTGCCILAQNRRRLGLLAQRVHNESLYRRRVS